MLDVWCPHTFGHAVYHDLCIIMITFWG
uniref:Uncharacterized protein n=1 Tax=Anguilla anguilla TaxID=7936 RepID=A0A0E9QYM2_ANGAN